MAAMTFAIGGIAFWMPYYLESRPGAGGAATITFGAITVLLARVFLKEPISLVQLGGIVVIFGGVASLAAL